MNEPVAWMYAVNGIWTAFSDELPPDDAYDEGTLTPLYTHPVKELTDELLMELYEAADYSPESYLELARAILTKAQEK